MKSEIKKLENSMIELTIEETKENVSKNRNKVIKNIRENADIKGFRKGSNIPEDVIVKNYGEEKINSMIIDEALNSIYSKALRDNKIMPVSQGEITQIVSQDPLIVKLKIEVLPEIEINDDYKKIKLKKSQIKVTKKEIDDNIDEIKKKFTKFEEAPKTHKAKLGDRVNINTKGFDKDGNFLENTNMEAYPLVLGSNLLVPGFEEKIVGAKAGDKLDLDITFPKDYHNSDFAGKDTKFEVEVNSIEKAVEPEFTKEFIKDLRGKDLDFEGFQDLIKEEIKENKETNKRMEEENKLMDELLKVSKVPFGPTLLKGQIDRVFEEVKQNIANSGAKVDDYLASLGMNKEDYIEKNIRPIAIKRLQSELILNKLKEIEKIEADEKDIEDEIKRIMDKFGSADVIEKLQDLYKPGTKYYEELKQRMGYRKLIDSFFE